jgi:aldose 1-epimerase
MGWHPYFVKQVDTKIKFKARAIWQMGEDKLPTNAVPSEGLDTHCDGLRVDHCFEGWEKGVWLEDSSRKIKIESNLDRLVVYTNPTLDCIAVEPVSHVNNAINLSNALSIDSEQLGVKILQPGESLIAQMSIKVKNKKPP